MSDLNDQGPRDDPARVGITLAPLARVVAFLAGGAGLVFGTLAVFRTDLEAGPVALLGVGALFLCIGLAGVLPTRIKVGDNELDWVDSVKRLERRAPIVERQLRNAGVTEESLIRGGVELTSSDKVTLASEASSLSADVDKISAAAGPDRVPPSSLLQLARSNAALQRWTDAGHYYDRFVQQHPEDWEIQFARGVAHANSRNGRQSDLLALAAYDAAIQQVPEVVPPDTKARLLIYRGAMKKRLGLLGEAELDVLAGRRLATSSYERMDATYNLASIKALQGDRDGAIEYIRELVSQGGLNLVLGHMDDYFVSLRDDEEFKSIMRSEI